MFRQLRIMAAFCVVFVCAHCIAQSKLDRVVSNAMAGRKGSAVVMEVSSGRMLVVYDLERAARRTVRPGSAIKPFVLATLVDAGLLRKESGVACLRTLTIAGRKLDCGHPQSGAPLHAEEALAYSCNTYFTAMGARLSATQLQRGLSRWGLVSRTGLVKDEALGEILLGASREEVQLQSIGEHKILVTPLGLINGYRRLALEQRSATAERYSVVYSGMKAATEYGMARLAQPAGLSYRGRLLRVSGKTGTSRADEGPWTHAWFAGFAPSDHPEIVVVVFLENGAGPVDAAPIAGQIFRAWAAEARR